MKKAKRGQGRKAQVASFLSDTFMLIFAVLLIIVFFVASSAFFMASKKSFEAAGSEYNKDSEGHISLYAVLQKQVEVDVGGTAQVMTVADLIRLGKIDRKYEGAAEAETKIFGEYYSCVFKTETIAQQEMSEILEAYEGYGSYQDYEFGGAAFYIPSDEPIAAMLKVKSLKGDEK